MGTKLTPEDFLREFLIFYYDCSKYTKSELNTKIDDLAEIAIQAAENLPTDTEE